MTVFSNSLELERRLRALGAHPDQLPIAFERLEHFQLRFRDEYYLLMGENQIDKAELAAALAHVTRTPLSEIVCVSCEAMEHGGREAQYRLYEMARALPMRRLLETEAYWRFANQREEGEKKRMIDVIKGAIGTRRLTLALDNTFGNSFASVFKHDIVAVWTMHFKSFVPVVNGMADADRIGSTGNLVVYLTKALPAFRLSGHPASWTVLTA
jgi:hypothetical protein